MTSFVLYHHRMTHSYLAEPAKRQIYTNTDPCWQPAELHCSRTSRHCTS